MSLAISRIIDISLELDDSKFRTELCPGATPLCRPIVCSYRGSRAEKLSSNDVSGAAIGECIHQLHHAKGEQFGSGAKVAFCLHCYGS